VSAVSRFDAGPGFLHDPNFPEEQDNDVWQEAMKVAVSEENSLFVDGQAAQKIIDTQMDLVKSDQKPVASALRDAAEQINAEIRKTVAEDPSLRRMYDERVRAVAGSSSPARRLQGKAAHVAAR